MANLTTAPSGNHLPGVRTNSEKKLGILHYTSCIDFGWTGDIRKRYTDFIVHEVRRDGAVVFLSDIVERDPADASTEPEKPASAPKERKPVEARPEPQQPPEIPAADLDALAALLGAEAAQALHEAYVAIVTGVADRHSTVSFGAGLDRSQRGRVHQEIRRVFHGRFETVADAATNSIVAHPAAGRRSRAPRRNINGPSWRGGGGGGSSGDGAAADKQAASGPYVHFTLYKENKDTMEAINHLARMLKMKAANFGFAGTKDRRAATTQRISVKYQGHLDQAWLNSRNTNIKVGDFSSHRAPIQLGQHGGNEFTITIKNVELARGQNCAVSHRLLMAEACVQAALDHIQARGFINYFGLQRFGTHAIGTHEVGLKILGGDFEGACDAILHVDADLAARLDAADVETVFQRDEVSRARAITAFRTGGDLAAALQALPKRFGAESAILQHLSRNLASRRDFCGALLKVTRGLRNLYIHAYQSLVWNWVVSQRWAKFGDAVVAGDLVLVESEVNPARYRQEGTDMSEDLNQDEENFFQEARVLTAADVASGQYSVFDIVLPVPGYDVLYPENEMGDYYAAFMGRLENGRLDPYRMRRPQKEFSLSGYYRKVMARFATVPMFFVRPYMDDAEQMQPTDLDEIRARKAPPADAQPDLPHTVDDRRRRTTPDRPQDPPEIRVNDAWIESTTQGGGSKRVKILQPDDDDEDDSHTHTTLDMPYADATATGMPTPEEVARLFDQGPPSYTAATAAAAAAAADATFSAASRSTSATSLAALAVSTTQQTAQPETSSPRTAAAATLPPAQHMVNVFRDAAAAAAANGRTLPTAGQALNLSRVWKTGLPHLDGIDDLKIAVVLNFRLSSSNYATICMREMMSTWLSPTPPAPTTTTTMTTTTTTTTVPPSTSHLGHGGHVHQEKSLSPAMHAGP